MTDFPLMTERAWQQFSSKLKNYLLQRVSDEQIADDLLQETFIRIHRKLDDITDTDHVSSWLLQIARNSIIDHYRAAARNQDESTAFIESETDDEERNVNEMVMGWLPDMTAQLPATYREAVELCKLQRIPQQQIADHLGISLSGAKSRIQRGRKKLKQLVFDCCLFKWDRRGNILGYQRNHTGEYLNGAGNCVEPQPKESTQ